MFNENLCLGFLPSNSPWTVYYIQGRDWQEKETAAVVVLQKTSAFLQ
jgi:hypothetical protein